MTAFDPAPVIDLADRRRADVRAALLERISSRVPERLDMVKHPGGHIWKRYEHADVALKVKRASGVGEDCR